MVMVHSDDRGLVLPPRVAPTQVVVIPIFFSASRDEVRKASFAVVDTLTASDIRCECDDRENYTPGWKFNHWEVKGVPLRIEVGPRDLANNQVVIIRRDLDEKSKVTVPLADLNQTVKVMLDDMQKDLYQRALKERDDRRTVATDWSAFMTALDKRNTVLAPHCEGRECEKAIKQRSGEASKADDNKDEESDVKETGVEKLTGAAKSLCIPFEQPELPANTKCVGCDKNAVNWTLFGRSY